jgi:hypothetical protein
MSRKSLFALAAAALFGLTALAESLPPGVQKSSSAGGITEYVYSNGRLDSRMLTGAQDQWLAGVPASYEVEGRTMQTDGQVEQKIQSLPPGRSPGVPEAHHRPGAGAVRS